MNQTTVDVSNIPNVKMRTKVTIIGTEGHTTYSAEDMAIDLETISYEALSDNSKRVQRFYKE